MVEERTSFFLMQVPSSTTSPVTVSPAAMSPPAPQTGTVGSFGSFWLPGDGDALRGSGSPARQEGKASRSSQSGKGNADKTSSEFKQEFRKSAKTSSSSGSNKSSPASPKAPSSSSFSPKTGNTFANLKAPSFHKANSVPSKTGSASLNNLARTPENVAHTAIPKARQPSKESDAAAKPDRFIHPDDQGNKKDERRRGAKRASSAGAESENLKNKNPKVSENFESQVTFVDKTSSSLVPNSSGRTPLPESMRPVLPALVARIALLAKEGRRVARFALDLPGGATLGVRIELSGASVRLAFVTSDSALRSVLASAGESISDHLSKSGFSSGEPLVAASYRELDAFVPKAA